MKPPAAGDVASFGAVVVTHDSGRYFTRLLDGLLGQTVPFERICIIDSGSADSNYLNSAPPGILITRCQNVGFAKGNNIGISQMVSDVDVVAMINPDCFLNPEVVERAKGIFNSQEGRNAGAITGIMLGFDEQKDSPSGLIDSAGIERSWLGRWADRGQGFPVSLAGRFIAGEVDAICGALMICRTGALGDVRFPAGDYFDEGFFMYKEDIDISLRLRRTGWRLLYDPSLSAYHCRGWKSRGKMAKKWRLMSARNEIRLHWRQKSPYFILSLCKYLFVWIVEREHSISRGAGQ